MTVRFWTSSLLSHIPGVVCGFTERHGGVSRHPFHSLNMGLHVGDLPDRVLENRRRTVDALGLSLGRSVCAEQIHGASVASVGLQNAGAGLRTHASALPGLDGLVSGDRGLALIGYFADCVPIQIAGRQGTYVALGHAGWRGTLAGIAGNLIKALERLGAHPRDLAVALGPCIKSCCYEVSDDLAAEFSRTFGSDVVLATPTGRLKLDLIAANIKALEKVGVGPDQIDVAPYCTACRTDLFYSHRIEGPRTGRMAAVIALKDG